MSRGQGWDLINLVSLVPRIEEVSIWLEVTVGKSETTVPSCNTGENTLYYLHLERCVGKLSGMVSIVRAGRDHHGTGFHKLLRTPELHRLIGLGKVTSRGVALEGLSVIGKGKELLGTC